MLDLSLITGTIGALKGVAELVSSTKDIVGDGAVSEKLIAMRDLIYDAQGKAIEAQSQLYEIDRENRELKEKLAAVSKWEETASRYRLVDYGGGTFAYQLNEDADTDEPPHRICAVCFENSRRSILQFEFKTSGGQDKYRCVPCNQEFMMGNYIQREPNVNRWRERK